VHSSNANFTPKAVGTSGANPAQRRERGRRSPTGGSAGRKAIAKSLRRSRNNGRKKSVARSATGHRLAPLHSADAGGRKHPKAGERSQGAFHARERPGAHSGQAYRARAAEKVADKRLGTFSNQDQSNTNPGTGLPNAADARAQGAPRHEPRKGRGAAGAAGSGGIEVTVK